MSNTSHAEERSEVDKIKIKYGAEAPAGNSIVDCRIVIRQKAYPLMSSALTAELW